MRTTASRRLIPFALIPIAAIALTGCSAVTDLVRNESEWHFDDATALRQEWTKADTVGWLPDDAVGIDVRETSDADPAVIRFESATGLDAADCAETERQSLPVFVDDWTPDDDEIVKLETVHACGDWAVAEIDGAWFGWTPSSPGEQESAP